MLAPAAVLFAVVASSSAGGTPALRASGDSDFPDQPFVFERLERTIRFEGDGTGRVTLAARIVVQSEAGVRYLGELTFPYDSASERLEVDTVRVLKVGGGVVLASSADVQDVTAPVGREAPMYSDLRQKVVTVPGLRPGDTLEYHVTWIEHTPIAPGEFWQAVPFLRSAVVLNEDLIVDVPRAKYVQVKTEGGPSPQLTETADRRIYRWRLSNLAVDTTNAASEAAQRAHGVQLTTFRTWADVGRWYAGLERAREALTPAIQTKAADLVRGRMSLRDSLTAIYDFVSLNYRYVSLSFGVGRYQPHPAAEVLVNDYGDCKDKHVLLAALLRAIGVTTAPVLISTSGDPDSTVPSPRQFDHVISYVVAGADTLWLDATPGTSPFEFLFYPLRGRTALVVPQDGPAHLVRTPATPPFPLFERVTMRGTLDPAGTVSSTLRYSIRGDEEVFLREVFRELPHEQLATFANSLLPRISLTGAASDVQAADPAATKEPFWFSFHIEQNASVQWLNRRAQYNLPLPSLDIPAEYDSSTAKDTLPLGAMPENTRELQLVLPPGTRAELPVPVALTRDYGEYRSTYAMHGDTLTANRSLRFSGPRLTSERAGDWNAFRRTVKADEQQSVTLVRSSDAPAASAPVTADADQLHQAGLDALEAGDGASAVRFFRQTVALQPRHPWAWNNLGRAYLQLNQLDSAESAFRKQIEVNPYDQYAYNNLGLAQWRRGELKIAAASFARQIEVSPLDRFAHANLGRVDLLLQRDSEAVLALRKAVSITPDDASARADLGRAWLRLHLTDSAVVEFDRAVELAPTPATWNTVAYALALSGERLDRAETYARSAVDATVAVLRTVVSDRISSQEMFAAAQLGSFWDTLGWIEFRRGNVRDSERYVRAAWLLAHHAEVGDHLGQIYEALGRKPEAMRAYAMAVNAMMPVSPADTRRRLQAVAGSAAMAERLADSGRTWLSEQRTIALGKFAGLDGAATVQVVVTPGPAVEHVNFLGGPPSFARLEGVIRQATMPIAFPDSSAIKLPLTGLVTCSSLTGECSLVLTGGATRPLADTRR